MEKEVSNIILGIAGPSDRFRIKWGWISFYLKIKPLTARQIIEISGEISRIKDINVEQDVFPALLQGSTDLQYIARVIAISTGTKWRRIVAKAILGLDLADIGTLFMLVRKNCDAERFFFIMALAKGMNKLKSQKEQPSEAKASSDVSQ